MFTTFVCRAVRFLGVLGALLLLAGPLGAGPAPVTVVVSPNPAALVLGQPQPFTAKVTGTTKTAVTWSCTGGTVDAGGGYTAPLTAGTYTVKATLKADTTKFGTAVVTVSRNIQIALDPTSASVSGGEQVAFSATVTGGTTNESGVTWTLSGGTVLGSNPTSLLLVAPATPGTYTILATSVEDPSKAATASLVVLDPSVITLSASTLPSPLTGTPLTKAQVSLTLRGGSTGVAIWSATGGVLDRLETTGSIQQSYQFPGLAGSYQITVKAKDDPTKIVTIPVSVVNAPTPTIYGLEVRDQAFLPGASAQVVPYFTAAGATATMTPTPGAVINGTPYSVQPPTLTRYLLKLKVNNSTSYTQLSDWVAPAIAATASRDVALSAATAYDQRTSGQSVVIRPDGKIVVAGGGVITPTNPHYGEPDTTNIPIADERIFDPSTGMATIAQGVVRAFSTPLLLADGRLQYFGGTPRDGVAFDSTVGSQGYGGEVSLSEGFKNRYSDAWALENFQGKRVLIGGRGAFAEWANAGHSQFFMAERVEPMDWVEIQDPATGGMARMRMQYRRAGGSVVLLRDGRVLAAGGNGSNEQPEVLNLTTLTSTLPSAFRSWWDSRTATSLFSMVGATLMADGQVLVLEAVAGGTHWIGIWDPVADTYARKLQIPIEVVAPFVEEPIGDGLYPLGFTTSGVSPKVGTHIVLYDSVRKVVVVTQDLGLPLGPDGQLRIPRWIGLTAEGTVLLEVLREGMPFSNPVLEPWRVQLGLPVTTFPASVSIPVAWTFKFSARSANPGLVTWSVLEGVTGGTVTPDGTYQAPATAGIYHVVATTPSGRSVSTIRAIPVPPEIARVTLDRTSAPVGGLVEVSWEVQRFDTLRLQARAANGAVLEDRDVTGRTTEQVTVKAGTTRFVVVATNASGQAELGADFAQWAVFSVQVNPSTATMGTGTIRTFGAIVQGTGDTPTTVTWRALDGGSIDASGNYLAPAQTGTYHIQATSTFDPTKTAQATITAVVPPRILSFTQNKTHIIRGERVELAWQLEGATRATLSGPPDSSGGSWIDALATSSVAWYPTESGVFTLMVENALVSDFRSLPITISPIWQIGITPSNVTATPGQQVSFGGSIQSTGNTDVTWTTTDPGGTLTSTDLSAVYTPGGTPGTYQVTITSVLDPTRSATATVTVIRPEVTLSITPGDTGLVTGQSLSFGSSISVTGSGNTSLVWTCTGGTLLPKGGSAFYTAPLVPGTYAVTATSVANPEVSASTSIQVSAPPTSTATLSALPTAAALRPNQRLFIGTAYRSTDPSAGLDWTASGGMLTVDGSTASAFYTALAEGATTVSIASRANPALTANVAVTVLASEAPAWAITPSALTLGTGQAAFFEGVDASGVIRSRVLWSIQEGPVGGSISDAGQYFAPTTAGTYHAIATNPDNPAETATATITVVSGGGGGGTGGGGDPTPTNLGVTVSPETSSLPAGTYQSLSAVVSGMEDQAVTWTVENDPGSANVDASGVFIANQAGTYRVFATSTPNQALKGSAVLTVVSSVTPLPNAPVVGTLRGYSVTALADGRILIAGGTDGPTFFATGRVFDPETKVFSNTPAMLAPRAYHTATLLADGRVLLAGGVGERDEFGGLVANAWAEVFNPVTNAFEALPEGPLPNGGTRAGVMRSPHATGVLFDFMENDGHGQSVATVLGNNQVLIAGGPMVHGYGFGGSFDQFPQRRMTDIFTPGTTPGMDTFDVSNWVGIEAPDDVQGWALTPNAILTPKGSQILTLNDGRALMTGGLVSPYQNLPVIPEPYRSGLIMPDSKTYSPGQGFADAAPMRVPRAYHTMTKLADGRVLIVGGYASLTLSDDFNTSLIWHRTTTGTAEVYDPATGGFTFVGSLIFPRARHAAILLPTGKVMIVGGRTTNGDGGYFHPKMIELFDPETGAFSVMENLEYGLEEPKLALMGDGNVFVTGQVKAPQSISMRMSAFMQAASATPTAGSTLLATITVNPPNLTLTFPKYWPKQPTGVYNFSDRTYVKAENIRMKIVDETNTEVWNDFLDDQGHTTLHADRSGVVAVDAIFGNTAKTFKFYVIPEIKIDLGGGRVVNAKVKKGTLTAGAATDFAPFLIKTQQGGPSLVGRPFSLDLSGLSASDRRAASGSLNMLWVYKRAMQFMAAAPGFNAGSFDNFQFWWDPSTVNDGITRFSSGNNCIYVRGDRSINADDFDDGVLLHELGHKVHSVFGPFRDLPSFTAPKLGNGHIANAAIDPELAWVEGWADFFQAAVKLSPSSGYPAGYQTTAMYDSGANGGATTPLVDPNGSQPGVPAWSNEIRLSRGLYLMLNNPGIGNGSIGTYLAKLNPGNGMDGFRSFLDRLGSGSAAAITSVLTSDGFTNPPPSPMDGPASLTLNAPSAAFRLLPQVLIAGTDYMTPREGSAYFTCTTTAGRDLKIRIQGLAASDIGSVGVRIIDNSGIEIPIPFDGMSGTTATYDAVTGSYDITITSSEWPNPLSLVSVYNRNQTRTFSNLILTVIE